MDWGILVVRILRDSNPLWSSLSIILAITIVVTIDSSMLVFRVGGYPKL